MRDGTSYREADAGMTGSITVGRGLTAEEVLNNDANFSPISQDLVSGSSSEEPISTLSYTSIPDLDFPLRSPNLENFNIPFLDPKAT